MRLLPEHPTHAFRANERIHQQRECERKDRLIQNAINGPNEHEIREGSIYDGNERGEDGQNCLS